MRTSQSRLVQNDIVAPTGRLGVRRRMDQHESERRMRGLRRSHDAIREASPPHLQSEVLSLLKSNKTVTSRRLADASQLGAIESRNVAKGDHDQEFGSEAKKRRVASPRSAARQPTGQLGGHRPRSLTAPLRQLLGNRAAGHPRAASAMDMSSKACEFVKEVWQFDSHTKNIHQLRMGYVSCCRGSRGVLLALFGNPVKRTYWRYTHKDT